MPCSGCSGQHGVNPNQIKKNEKACLNCNKNIQKLSASHISKMVPSNKMIYQT